MNPIILVVLVLISAVLIVYGLMPRGKDEQEAVLRRMAGKQGEADVNALRKRAKESVTKKVMDRVAPIAVRPMKPVSPLVDFSRPVFSLADPFAVLLNASYAIGNQYAHNFGHRDCTEILGNEKIYHVLGKWKPSSVKLVHPDTVGKPGIEDCLS